MMYRVHIEDRQGAGKLLRVFGLLGMEIVVLGNGCMFHGGVIFEFPKQCFGVVEAVLEIYYGEYCFET